MLHSQWLIRCNVVLQVAPDHVQARGELARVYRLLGEEEKAFELTEESKPFCVT